MSDRRPRVLLVVLFQPWPVRNGITRRLSSFAASLHAAADLHVVVTDVDADASAAPPGMSVSVAPRNGARWRSAVEVLRGLPALDPVTVGFYRRGAVRRQIARAIREHRPDVVVTHGPGGAALVDGLLPGARIVLDADTVDPDTFRRIARESRGAARLKWAVDAPLMARWHRRHLPRYAGVTVVSEADVATYAELVPGARVTCVPNGVDLPAAPRPDPGGAVLVYVGDRDYPPNAAAVTWFVEQVLPALPDVQLRLVGPGPAPAHPQVVSLGRVPDVAAVWAEATAQVVPLRSGGGTRLKVLESFAAGVPVVSTTFGVEGIGAVAERHYLAGDSPDEMAAAVRRVVDDVALRGRLAGASYEFVSDFTWERTTAPLLALVREVAS